MNLTIFLMAVIEVKQMNGYLTFLKNLSEYQQRAEIGHLAFTERWSGSSLEEDLLQYPAVAAFSETLGGDPSLWTLELKHYAEEAELIGTPVFRADQCRAPFSLRYSLALRSLDHNEDLVVRGMIYIGDDQSAVIRTLGASSTREKSCARERLIAAGIDPDTLETVAYDAEVARKMPYLDYLRSLLPQQRREAIFDLAGLAWGKDNPLFMSHPKLASELRRLGIRELGIADPRYEVGPIEFAGGGATAPVLYPLYGGGKDSQYDKGGLGYYVPVHILAGIGNKSGVGGDIWVQDLWFRVESIDDPPSDTTIPLLVP
jgi:hypothetical protein